jgi:hypothetical protein
MSRRGAASMAWGLFAATVVLFVLSAVLGLSRPPIDGLLGTQGLEEIAVSDLFFVGSIVAFPLVGALVASRRPDNPMGWILAGGSCAFMAGIAAGEYALNAVVVAPGTLPAAAFFAWLSEWMTVAGIAPLLTFTFLLFPDGRPPSPRWRWLVHAFVALAVVGLGALMLKPGPLQSVSGALDNPFGIERAGFLRAVDQASLPMFIVLIVACVASLFVRYRHAGAETRLQIRWLGYAGLMLPVVLGMWVLEDLGMTPPRPVADIFAVLAFWGLPAAIGIAILRYRLYDIDVVINRTLVYGLLTAILAASYLGIVAVTQLILQPLTPQSDLSIVISTLAVAALFRPLRARLQTFIDRRFYRQRYDAAATLDRFSARLRDQVDLESLRSEVVGVVGTTMQPAHASLWLRPREEAS